MSRVVIFAFAGSRRYLELQEPYVLELLSRYPNVEYHLWDVTRRAEDRAYLHELASESSQIRVLDVPGGDPWAAACTYYARDENYRTDQFVKLGGDVVFIQTERFDAFVAAVENSLLGLVGATVAEPAACPSFFDDLRALLDQEPASHPIPRGRFALHAVGCNWYVMRWIAERLRSAAGANPEHVIATSFDIRIMRGFVACRLRSDDRERELLAAYAELRDRYLGTAVANSPG